MQQHQPTLQHTKPPRLKILLLGSSGAGKTSLLRRFVNGTFQGGTSGDYNETTKNRRQRNTMSTLGADYYVKRMDNPLFERREIDDSITRIEDCCTCHSPRRMGGNNRLRNESHILVQLWDSRGSEPTFPRYNRSRINFNMYQFLSLDDEKKRKATKDDYYRYGYHLHRYNNWGMDTPSRWEGCINFNIPKDKISKMIPKNILKSQSNVSMKNQSPPNALFDNVDACMLVYDATSSISFLRLMAYHQEWIRRLQYEEQSKPDMKWNRRVPFIVIANKIDLLDGNSFASSKTCGHRSVMGFENYRGIDETYEYAAENILVCPQCHCSCFESTSKSKEDSNKLTYSLKETYWSSDYHYLSALQQADAQLSANRRMILLWCERNGIQHIDASALDGRGVDLAMNELVRLGAENRIFKGGIGGDLAEENSWKDEGAAIACSSLYEHFETGNETETEPLFNDGANMNGNETCSTAHRSISDPPKLKKSQNTFLYEPKYDKNLDLFARYSTQEEKRWLIKCFGC